MTQKEERINELFEKLVPTSGKAPTVAGEIVRAISRIGYRWYNDGDQLGIGYGRETCNPAGRYLAKTCDDAIATAVTEAWGIYDEHAYSQKLDALEDTVLDYLERHPELEKKDNTEDMWEYRDPDEDKDEDEEDDEDWEEDDYDEEEDW